MICCSDFQLNVWHVSYRKEETKYEQKEISGIEEVFTLQTTGEINNVKISPDVRFFTTKEERAINLWDFDSLNEQPYKLS